MKVSDVLWPFLRLGATAFGGPAASIAMMEEEFVTRRGWITRQHFLDLVGATNLIPGPNSTEMVMHIGYERAGGLGLVVAGVCFIVPAVVLSAALAAFYSAFGALPEIQPLFEGIKPVVVVIIAVALHKLGRQALRSAPLVVLALAVMMANLAGLPEVPALVAGGVMGMLALRPWRGKPGASKLSVHAVGLMVLGWTRRALALPVAGAVATKIGLPQLFLVFLKIGAVLYGSGYVLFAFIEGEMVTQRGWLTQAQLLDAIAIGQFTPGPVLSSATFVGYLVGGWQGATVATVGIFLPSFFFVLLLQKVIGKLRKSAWTSAFLDAVNAAALALMASTLLRMGQLAMASPVAWLIALLAALAILRFKVNVAYVVIGGAVLGWLLAQVS